MKLLNGACFEVLSEDAAFLEAVTCTPSYRCSFIIKTFLEGKVYPVIDNIDVLDCDQRPFIIIIADGIRKVNGSVVFRHSGRIIRINGKKPGLDAIDGRKISHKTRF